MFAITADQRDSRTGGDLVPDALAALTRVADGRLSLPAERTAGDELQALTASAPTALDIALHLVRSGQWSVGIGIGGVETPLPRETRAARGDAFVYARDAVERAKESPLRLAVGAESPTAARDAEALIGLLIDLRDRRSPEGWEVADLLAQGMTQKRAAETLGISASAVSLRVKAAGLRIEADAVPALARMLSRIDAAPGAEV